MSANVPNAPVLRRREESGSALILAALVTVILSLLGLSYLMMAQTENTIAENERNSAAALYVAEAGARLAIVWINDPTSTGYLVPTTSDMDRTKRIFDHDNNTATARVQGVSGDATKPIYKDATYTASPVFDRPYRGSLADTFLGIETGTDTNVAFATMGPDVILNDTYLATVSNALFPNFPSVSLRARLTRVEIYAPPIISIGGTETRMGIATVKAIAGVFQYPGTAAERQIATRIVKAVVNEIPVPGPVGPLQSCNNLGYNGDFQIHWGTGSAVGNADIPSNTAKWPQGLPYATNDPFTYVQSPTLASWAATQAAASYSIPDPWAKFIAGGAIAQAGLNTNVQPFTVDYANPSNDHSNLFQHTVINCPTFDYALWKSIAQSGMRNMYYYKWVSGTNFSLDGSGPSTDFRVLTDNKAGVYFFDTQDQLAPSVSGTNLTPAISLSGGSYVAMGFLYVNAADFGTTGLGGRTHTVFPPGEPGDGSGFVNLDYPGTLTGAYLVKSTAFQQKFQDPETGDYYCLDTTPPCSATAGQAASPVKDSTGLPFQTDVMLDGVFYISGTFEAQGNSQYFGSVVAERGVVDGGGTPNFYFDERLIKGQWPPKGMPLPRVVISAWETDL